MYLCFLKVDWHMPLLTVVTGTGYEFLMVIQLKWFSFFLSFFVHFHILCCRRRHFGQSNTSTALLLMCCNMEDTHVCGGIFCGIHKYSLDSSFSSVFFFFYIYLFIFDLLVAGLALFVWGSFRPCVLHIIVMIFIIVYIHIKFHTRQ